MVKPVAGYRPSYSSPEPVQPTGTVAENAMRFPPLAHRAAADHKLHSTRQQHEMKLISGNGETSSRLPAFSLFLPGTCPNNRDRRARRNLGRRRKGSVTAPNGTVYPR